MVFAIVVAIGLTVIGVGVAIHFELRSACFGISLSNGLEVMVSPEMYRTIVARYRSGSRREPESWRRWDHAVLEVLRPERPNEWRYLIRSLGPQAAEESVAYRRVRQTV